MKECIVCGEKTDQPIAAAFEHFYLYVPGNWRYWRGNIKTFGFWSGLSGSLGITFPIYNTLRHWKHRKSRLVLDSSNNPEAK